METLEYSRTKAPSTGKPEDIIKWAEREFTQLERVIHTLQDRLKTLEANNGT